MKRTSVPDVFYDKSDNETSLPHKVSIDEEKASVGNKRKLKRFGSKKKNSEIEQRKSNIKFFNNQQLFEAWVETILPDWNLQIHSALFDELVAYGIPHDVRGQVWKNLIGNHMRIEPEQYDYLMKKVEFVRKTVQEQSTKYLEERNSKEFSSKDKSHDEWQFVRQRAATQYKRAQTQIDLESDSDNDSPPRSLGLEVPTTSGSEIENNEKPQPMKMASFGGQSNKSLIFSVLVADDPECRNPDKDGYKSNNKIPTSDDNWEMDLIKTFEDISIDLHRTIPRVSPTKTRKSIIPLVAPLLNNPKKIQNSLRNVLESHAVNRKDLGYVQGMGHLACFLLLHMDEYSAFVCFSHLLVDSTIYDLYKFDVYHLEILFRTFEILMITRWPKVSKNLRNVGITVDMFLVEWFYTLFTRCLPLDIVARIWDLFLLKKEIVLFQTSLALIGFYHLSLETSPIEDCMAILSVCKPKEFSKEEENRFLKHLSEVNLTKGELSFAKNKSQSLAKIISQKVSLG